MIIATIASPDLAAFHSLLHTALIEKCASTEMRNYSQMITIPCAVGAAICSLACIATRGHALQLYDAQYSHQDLLRAGCRG